MAESIQIQAEKRDQIGSKPVRELRNSGYIPAVLYGKDLEPLNLKLNSKEFTEIYHKAGSSTVLDLKVDGSSYPVLIQDLSINPLTDQFIHADFYKVRLDQIIEATVELNFIGESFAVKDLGGVLVKNIDEIEVKALPGDLPRMIDVDISSINEIGESILIRDIKVAEGVEILDNEEEIVATVVAAREEEEEVPVEEEAGVEDVEVIEKGKEEEGEAPAEEAKEGGE